MDSIPSDSARMISPSNLESGDGLVSAVKTTTQREITVKFVNRDRDAVLNPTTTLNHWRATFAVSAVALGISAAAMSTMSVVFPIACGGLLLASNPVGWAVLGCIGVVVLLTIFQHYAIKKPGESLVDMSSPTAGLIRYTAPISIPDIGAACGIGSLFGSKRCNQEFWKRFVGGAGFGQQPHPILISKGGIQYHHQFDPNRKPKLDKFGPDIARVIREGIPVNSSNFRPCHRLLEQFSACCGKRLEKETDYEWRSRIQDAWNGDYRQEMENYASSLDPGLQRTFKSLLNSVSVNLHYQYEYTVDQARSSIDKLIEFGKRLEAAGEVYKVEDACQEVGEQLATMIKKCDEATTWKALDDALDEILTLRLGGDRVFRNVVEPLREACRKKKEDIGPDVEREAELATASEGIQDNQTVYILSDYSYDIDAEAGTVRLTPKTA